MYSHALEWNRMQSTTMDIQANKGYNQYCWKPTINDSNDGYHAGGK